MIIREMTIDDYDEVYEMWLITTKRALSKADERDQMERYLKHNAGMSQVAVVDGKIVGTVLAGHDGRRGFIHHMAVLPEFRRKKIGHALAQTAIQKIREQGIDKTHIFCYQNNETGQSFWRDFGFEKREDVFVYSFSNDKIRKGVANLTTKEKDLKYIMHTYGRYDVALKNAKGVTAYDENGKKYIDVSSGIGVNSLGYCNDGWVEAVSKQAGTIQHMSNYFYCSQASDLAEKLCTLTGLSKVCFGNSGAEANECAIKIARKYSFDKYGEGRNEIVTLNNSFHGRTVTTLAATGQDVFHNYFFPFTEGFKYADADDMDALKAVVSDKTCAVMLELIQGEGGVNILDPEYVKELVKYCNDNDILVIVDEVQTGVGRTGKLFAHQNYGILPDLMTVAKGLGGGLPIGVCMCGEKLKDVMSPSTHGTTFGANPVVCAGANYVLDTVANDEFLAEVEKKGQYFEDKLTKIDGVKSVRRMGLMIGIELEKGDAHDIAIKCVENGLLIITAKDLLRMLPPLVIDYNEIDEAINILEKAIKENN